jgi:hypothetical protein
VRLSQNKIKAAILDTDLEIRQRAIRYFAKSYSTDRSVSQLSQEGIEEARKLLVGRKPNMESLELRNYLVETCTIMGERFPEYDEWLATEKAEKAEHWRRVNELEGDPNGLLLFALEKLARDNATETTKATKSVPHASLQRPAPKSESQQRVGRNDPCPCGSGKKFKQCCLKRQGG